MELEPSPQALKEWAPVRIYRRGGEAFVDWCHMGGERFTQPFFDDTVRSRLRIPFNLLFRHQTPLEYLRKVSAETPGLSPTGFIFHMSRCGSTLVAQMLASVPDNIVISEAPPVDSVLAQTVQENATSGATRVELLRTVISTLGRPRTGESRYFIKFDSWNTLDLDVIRAAFPDVPWIFLYRDPVEVIVSQMRQRGSQMIPGALLARILTAVSPNEAVEMPAEVLCARVLARICDAALAHAGDPNALFVNYRELPGSVTETILRHFGVDPCSSETALMNEAARYNAKTPQLFFEPDSRAKQLEANETARRASEEWVAPHYARLETLRANLPK